MAGPDLHHGLGQGRGIGGVQHGIVAPIGGVEIVETGHMGAGDDGGPGLAGFHRIVAANPGFQAAGNQ